MHNLTSLDLDDCLPICIDTNLAILKLLSRAFGVSHERPRLKSLRLKGLHPLHHDYDKAFPPLLGLQGLEDLQLVFCTDYVPFLQMLKNLSLKLKSFSVFECTDIDNGEFDHDANEFVRSMSSLQRLSLVLDPLFEEFEGTLLDWSILHAYASGLKCLKLHCNHVKTLFPSDQDASDFRRFCTKASSLQQLSVSGVEIQPKPFTFGSNLNSLANFLV
jgi:hypothetical protein